VVDDAVRRRELAFFEKRGLDANCGVSFKGEAEKFRKIP
jgi:hypothetical protein